MDFMWDLGAERQQGIDEEKQKCSQVSYLISFPGQKKTLC
jgi:hypothetical protein